MDIRMRRARSLVTAMIGSGVAAMLAGSAAAAPIAVGEGAFSGSATLIDFNGTAFNQVIDNEYAPLGVTFSGPLYAHIFSGDPAPSAANYPFGQAANTNPITIDFSSTMLRVGFDVATPTTGDTLTVAVSAFSGGNLVSTGNVLFGTGSTWSFAGIEDSVNGIDRLVLSSISSTGSRGFAIDNFRFEAASAVVPEPSAALLFPVGMLLAASRMRRREARNA